MTASQPTRQVQKSGSAANLLDSGRGAIATSPEVGDSTSAPPSIWVKKWVDYSQKYGLGYLLSNGAAGVFFNDSTKIIL
jgi:hypothetical protein